MNQKKPSLHPILVGIMIGLGLHAVYSPASFAGESLETRYLKETIAAQPIPSEITDITLERHFLFIPGFSNEYLSRLVPYFGTQRRVIREFYNARSTYKTLSSFRSVEENASRVAHTIIKTYFKHLKPIVVLAHSMGSTQTLIAILTHPEIIKYGMVDKIVLIQSAVMGTSMTEPCIDGYWPQELVRSCMCALFRKATNDLNPTNAKALIELHLSRLRQTVSEEEYRTISDKVFWVRSYEHEHNLTHNLKHIAKMVPKKLGLCEDHCERCIAEEKVAHDGLLTTCGQFVPHFGKDLGLVVADHISLVLDSPLASTTLREREAFTRALMWKIFEGDVSPYSENFVIPSKL